MDIAQIQNEHLVWATRNFPTDVGVAYRSLLGVVEEFGELVGALGEGNAVETQDAIADMTIFMLGYCSAKKWALQTLVRAITFRELQDSLVSLEASVTSEVLLLALARFVGKLCHAQLKSEQRIRLGAIQNDGSGMIAVIRIVNHLCLLCGRLGLDYEESVLGVWKAVSARDWISFPENGLSA